MLFDEDGELNDNIEDVLVDLIFELNYSPLSDAVRLYHWRNARSISKNCVTTIYAWR